MDNDTRKSVEEHDPQQLVNHNTRILMCLAINILVTLLAIHLKNSKPVLQQSLLDEINLDQLKTIAGCVISVVGNEWIHLHFRTIPRIPALILSWSAQFLATMVHLYLMVGIITRYAQIRVNRMLFQDSDESLQLSVIRSLVILLDVLLCLILVAMGEPPRFYRLHLGVCVHECPSLNLKIIGMTGILAVVVNIGLRLAIVQLNWKNFTESLSFNAKVKDLNFVFLLGCSLTLCIPSIFLIAMPDRYQSTEVALYLLAVVFPSILILFQKSLRLLLVSKVSFALKRSKGFALEVFKSVRGRSRDNLVHCLV
ncbi:hypothetical protein TCAL_14726 [Tigriopus californicus]|uniref:Uncharacterized protein n=1 Tax=Tigriopus californicus TaxID=6832 RepID=A0A553PGS8_TIGCA|nr:hypothetical protein TCAL_14726 [Tigriopus californicus]